MKFKFIVKENEVIEDKNNYYKRMYMAGTVYLQKLNNFKEKQQDESEDTSIFKDIKFV